MSKLIYDNAKKMWFHLVKNDNLDDFYLEIDLHEKLLNFFQVGEFYYYIFESLTGIFEYVSPNVEKVTGIKSENFTVAHVLNAIHPNDIATVLNFENTVVDFLRQLPADKVQNYKFRYDYRFKKPDGNYIRVLQQAITIHSTDDGRVLRSLVSHTDITDLKRETKMSLSFVGLHGEPSYFDVETIKTTFQVSEEVFTAREKEILYFLGKGQTSRQIGLELGIAKLTVDTHRKNMLSKTNCSSTTELITIAITEGWL